MAHSMEDVEGEKVETYFMSVMIEAVSNKGSKSVSAGGAGSNRSKNMKSVSRSPNRATSSSTTGLKLLSSQELVENALGTLLSVGSYPRTLQKGPDGVIRVAEKKGSEKVHLTKNKDNQSRKSSLRKRQSLQLSTSPRDLGRVSKSPLQRQVTPSPPSLVVTSPTNDVQVGENGTDNVVTSSACYITNPSDNPICSATKRKQNDGGDTSSKGNINNNDLHNGNQESEMKEGDAQNKAHLETDDKGSAGASNELVGQRSTDYVISSEERTQSSDISEALTNAVNEEVFVAERKISSVGDPVEECTQTNYEHERRESSGKFLQQPHSSGENNTKEICHGQECVRHYHHHSHHHHYHYYDNNINQNASRCWHHADDQCFFADCNHSKCVDEDVERCYHEDLDVVAHQENIHLDHVSPSDDPKQDGHYNKNLDNTDRSHSLKYVMDDISFYRKFSVTTPPPTFNAHSYRSKSSFGFPAADYLIVSGTSPITGESCSIAKGRKSRSTPIKLDSVGSQDSGTPPSPPPATPILPDCFYSDASLLHQYGCKCKGCLLCCNIISCGCCCDDCCCARQYGHLCEPCVQMGDPLVDSYTSKSKRNPNEEKYLSALHLGKMVLDSSEAKHSYLGKKWPETFDANADYYQDAEEDMIEPKYVIDGEVLGKLEHSDDSDDDIPDGLKAKVPEGHCSTSSKRANYYQTIKDAANGAEKDAQVISIGREGNAQDMDGKTYQYHTRKVISQNGDGNRIRSSTSLVVVGSTRGGSGSSISDTEDKVSPGSTNFLLVRQSSVRSKIRHSTGNGQGKGHPKISKQRNTSSGASLLRTATGEVRSSPVMQSAGNPDTGNLPAKLHPESQVLFGNTIVAEQTHREAVMTVTVDTMSLFLDAVHLQMNQN